MANAPIITVQSDQQHGEQRLGQCGNQVGGAFFQQLSQQLMRPVADSIASTPARASGGGGSGDQQRPEQLEPVPAAQFSSFQRSIASRFFRAPRARRGGGGGDGGDAASASAAGAAAANPLPVARAVLIDMEPKVIQQALKHADNSGSFAYDHKRTFYRQSGSGNNWAYGYSKHGMECRSSMLDLVRLESERCDGVLGGFLVATSLAGGTGSGVGAYLTECLRDEFSGTPILNQVVWPYAQGEVIVQNYNALLTLAHLQEYSDGILVFENDSLHEVCSRRLGMRTPSFEALNTLIAEALVNIVAPARFTQALPFYASTNGGPGTDETISSALKKNDAASSVRSNGGSSKPQFVAPSDSDLLRGCRPLHLWGDALAHLVPHPSLKLTVVRTVPQVAPRHRAFGSGGWHAILKNLAQVSLTAAECEDGLDWTKKSYTNKELPGATQQAGGKRKWHKHFSASARAASLYDPHTMFDAPSSSSASSVPAASVAAATAAASFSSAAANAAAATPVPSVPLFDFESTLPAAPTYLGAFRDGESFLEHRLLMDSIGLANSNSTRHTLGGAGTGARASSSRRSSSSTVDLDDDYSDPAAASSSSSSYCHALSQLLFLRGSAVCSADASAFLDPSLYACASLNPLGVLRSAESPLRGGGFGAGAAERTATAWTNGQGVVGTLDRMLEKVYGMLKAEAYTHHYKKYGIEVEQMWQQVCSMEQVCSDYKALTYSPD